MILKCMGSFFHWHVRTKSPALLQESRIRKSPSRCSSASAPYAGESSGQGGKTGKLSKLLLGKQRAQLSQKNRSWFTDPEEGEIQGSTRSVFSYGNTCKLWIWVMPLTSRLIGPWYQAWLLMSSVLSFSSSSSSFFRESIPLLLPDTCQSRTQIRATPHIHTGQSTSLTTCHCMCRNLKRHAEKELMEWNL